MATSPGILSGVRVEGVRQVGRVTRRPQHQFHIRHTPWAIQPFMLAPVLPGDTLKNLLLQSRVVTDPIKNPLIGWWCEHYFFYVKHRAMPNAGATLQTMMLDPSESLAALKVTSAFLPHYRNANSQVDFVGEAMTAIVKNFFRDEAEVADGTWDDHLTASSIFKAQINNDTWLQSALTKTAFDSAAGSMQPSVPVVDTAGDANTTLDAHEVEAAMRHYNLLRDMRLTDMTYEDYLRSYGVNIPDREEQFLPELVRYVRSWSYPSNTIDPTDGDPSSAVSWSVAERADKDRFFREPGFLIGCSVVRPKVYLSNQTSAAGNFLDNLYAWMPQILGTDDVYSALKAFTNAQGPLVNQTDGYVVDLKDLFMYGDQFVNFATSATDAGMVAVPTAALQKKYVPDASIDALFDNAAGGFNLVRQDGVVSLNILSRVIDNTAKT